MNDPLPTEEERKQLCELMYHAFVELRYFNGKQANDLAYALHNLPREIYGWGTWNVSVTKARLQHYQDKYEGGIGFDYVKFFDQIFPQK